MRTLGASSLILVLWAAGCVGGASTDDATASAELKVTAVPTTPKGMNLVSGDSQVSLGWKLNPAADHVQRYQVYRDDKLIADGPTAATFVDTGLQDGATYTYRVSAWNARGYGPWTAAQSATPRTSGPAAVPLVPSGLKVTAGDAKVSLTWSASPAADDVQRYQVYRDDALVADGPTATAYVDTAVTNGTTYAYRVSALNQRGYGPWTAAIDATPQGSTPPPTSTELPNLSAIANNGSQSYDQGFIDQYKHIDLILIGGNWEGWSNGGTRNRQTVVTGVKAGDGTVRPKVVQYGLIDSVDTSGNYSNSQSASPTLWNKIAAQNWYLWSPGTSGTHTKNFYNASFWALNSTDFVPSDASGYKLEDWFATYQNSMYRTASNANAAAALDGFFHDNVEAAPYAPGGPSGDWNRDGTDDVTNSPTVASWYRTGLARWATQQRVSFPGGLAIANADWGVLLSDGTRPYLSGDGAIAPLSKVFDGTLIEGAFGASYSISTWGTTPGAAAQNTSAMQLYQYHEDNVLQPQYGMVSQYALTAQGTDPYRTSPGQALRYSFAFTLVCGNFSYSFTDGDYTSGNGGKYADLHYFDEFSVNPATGVAYAGWDASAPGRKWIGTAVDPRQSSARVSGVFYRTFKHTGTGKRRWIFWNPRGNGSRTFAAPFTMKRLTGTQVPQVNSGAVVNAGASITIPDSDGGFFIEP